LSRSLCASERACVGVGVCVRAGNYASSTSAFVVLLPLALRRPPFVFVVFAAAGSSLFCNC